MKKSLIIYVYYNSDSSNYNLDYFLKNGIIKNDNVDYILVINGHQCDIEIPNYKNLKIIRRDNVGFDSGGWKEGLDTIKDFNYYNYYFFLNSSVTGPILRDNSNKENWVKIFTDKITDDVKLVGTTICFLKETDKGGYGPKIEGFFSVTDNIGLKLMLDEKNIFCCHETFEKAIINGEYGKTRCILKNNYNIDCMLEKYKNIDWRLEKNWNNEHLWYNKPLSLWTSKKNSYFGKDVNPYDVIFHKHYWSYNNTYISIEIMNNHIKL